VPIYWRIEAKPEEFAVTIQATADLGATVRDARHRLGLNQEALALRAGVSARWLRSLEGGKSGCEFGLVLQTLAALDLAFTVTSAPDIKGEIDLDDVLSRFDRLQ